ncbi:molybdopterin molybdotransferase MoeA [Corynebacterium sp. Q4381]|uniref:molybdopterin molybdotransferase MoeA n=1 Tax=Corynebacterium sp. Marseille-Q4381 TaxID=3121597 RepID=UPI002FE5886F
MPVSPEAHLNAVQELVTAHAPNPRTQRVLAADALGRVLARDLVANGDMPPFDNSQMDGYALPRAGAAVWEVGPTVAAGADPDAIYPDGLGAKAAPVMTGAKLPRGTAAVVPVEACEPAEFVGTGDTVTVPDCAPGQFMRRAGSDVAAGDVIAPAGTLVTPVVAGVLASQCVEEVEVRARRRIIIVTGGKEVGGAGAAQIPDTNTPMLEALAARHGIEVAATIRTDDDPEALAGEVERGVDKHAPDAIVTSGGISHGKFEVVRQVFADGWYGHVAQQPGGPQGRSVFRGVPVVSLPGNPVSTLVSFRLFVAPVLGQADEPVWAPVSEAITGLEGREQFLRGRITHGRATPMGGAGSHLLNQAAEATCLIRVPAGTELAEGDLALIYPL